MVRQGAQGKAQVDQATSLKNFSHQQITPHNLDMLEPQIETLVILQLVELRKS